METQDDPQWRQFEKYLQEITELRQLVIEIEERNNELERIAGSSSPVDVAYFPSQSGVELNSNRKRKRVVECDKVTYEELLLIIDDEKLRRSLVPQSGREKSPGLGVAEPNKGTKKFDTPQYKRALAEIKRAREYQLKREAKQKQLQGLPPQSGVEGVTVSKSMPMAKYATMNFDDEVDSHHYIVDSEYDNTRYLRDKEDANLDDFFKRPVRIGTYPWEPGVPLIASFNPWAAFLDNPRVVNRISNYKLLRGKLRVKVVINGNGFYYGRLLVAYNPLPVWDDLSTHSGIIETDLVHTTQLPHLYIDPTTSQGGEMTLPFFWYEDYIDIVNSDWVQMGDLYLRTLNPLKHANGATTPLDVTIFAWMEDIEYAVPCSLNALTMSPQSGKEIDEANKTGVISGPASVISKAAKVASGISMIAPYAMATSKAADIIGGIAKLFGYCSPPITKAPEPYRPQNTSSLAITNVPKTLNRLVLDEKQELTIDPRIAGLSGDDPMNIRNIAAREAYYTKFNYSVTQATDDIIFQMAVNPVIWRNFPASVGTGYMFPPCAMASMPFEYWTGTMKYRFQIVSSSFHKGRLRIGYDPHSIPLDPEYNVNYQRIVDISTDRDVTIEVGPAQTTALMRGFRWTFGDDDTLMYKIGTGGQNLAFNPGNGYIFVSVLNELTVPNSEIDNDIEINVFVSAGDDFEVFVPTSSEINRLSFFDQGVVPAPASAPLTAQSGVEDAPNSMSTDNDNAPFSTNSNRMGTNEQVLTDLNKVFVGEAIASFRPLLKRDMLHESLEFASGQRISSFVRSYFPKLQGYAPDSPSPLEYNFVPTNLLHWVRYAFQGHRGSIRWKMLPHNSSTTGDVCIYASRLWKTGTQESTTSTIPGYGDQDANGFHNLLNDVNQSAPNGGIASWDGAAYTDASVNNCLEVEIPYYSNYRFSPGKDARYSSFSLYDPSFRWRVTASTNIAGSFDTWCSTGEDFQVYFWTGLPRMYDTLPPIPPNA